MTDRKPSLDQVAEFSRAFGYPVNETPHVPQPKTQRAMFARSWVQRDLARVVYLTKRSAESTGDPCAFRLSLIVEELEELADAMAKCDAVGVLDALVDLRYVLDGTTHLMGMGGVFDEAMRRVHASNMTKLGADGRPVYDAAGKATKCEGYLPPKLDDLVGGGS